ncbi:uncharacterized protein LOC121260695 isoform X2 [Juglans microcarpa x Juglans regia]|uniref:uncharacterized protein LOC121260695 isoform X2 n=1 Tax=Juglans microcarpa x Juglans regia TaxID=2249226 RepID=UPI001B7E4004|nr:uncharacterized protein LOC121260695 isoform X2 [Juglans microcarpa x Juglans regia]
MAEKKEIVPPKYDLDAKWDACLDLTVRRFVYSSLAGTFGGLLLFMAFGAGVGIGSAYTDCSRLFDGTPAKVTTPKNAETPAPGSTESPGPKITETPAVQEAGTEN